MATRQVRGKLLLFNEPGAAGNALVGADAMR